MKNEQVAWARSRGGVAVLAILVLATVSAFALGLFGCSGSKTSASSAAEESSSPTEFATYIGTWDFTSITMDGKTYTESQLDDARKKGFEFFVNINEDGTWLLCLADERGVVEGTWSEGDDGKLAFANDGDSVGSFVFDGDRAKFLGQSLKKSGEVKVPPKARDASSGQAESSSATEPEPEPEPEAEPAEEAAADSGEVSPDVKEALDSYEQVMDEYVDFMKRYKESGNAVSMLSEYTEMLQKYTDFSAKIEAMDTNNMSKADYAYYIEVTSRVSQKLLEAL